MADELVLKNNVNTSDMVTSIIKNEYYINIDSEIGDASLYRGVNDILRKATIHDKVFIVLNTPGGDLNTGVQLYNSVLNCEAYTVAIVFEAASAGSLLAFACNEIQVGDFGFMMIHSLSSGVFGKQEDIKNMTEFLCDWGDSILSVYKGFLTVKEIEEVKKGKELWLNKKEIDTRLVRWKSSKKI